MSNPEEVRSKLAALHDRCSPGCQGWAVFQRYAIQRCDDCWNGHPDPLFDDDVAQLPEAQAALAQTIEHAHREEHGTCYGLFAAWCPHCLAKLSWLKKKEERMGKKTTTKYKVTFLIETSRRVKSAELEEKVADVWDGRQLDRKLFVDSYGFEVEEQS